MNLAYYSRMNNPNCNDDTPMQENSQSRFRK